MVISLSELMMLVELSLKLAPLMTFKLVRPNSISNRMISTRKLMMLAFRLTASMPEPLMTKLMRALWTTLQVSKTAALMVFSTDKLNSLNSMVSTTDSIAAPPMAVSDISAPKTPTKRAANTVNATFTSLTSLSLTSRAALMVNVTPTLTKTNTTISAISTKPLTAMTISMIRAAAHLIRAALTVNATFTSLNRRAANTVNATFTSLTSRAAPMDSAVLTILTTTVLFTVASVLSAVDTDTVATLLAAATVDTEDHTTEKISFNPFKEVFKADKLLL